MNILEIPKAASILSLSKIEVMVNIPANTICNLVFNNDCTIKKLKFKISFYLNGVLDEKPSELERIVKDIELYKRNSKYFYNFQIFLSNPLISNTQYRWRVHSDILYDLDFVIVKPAIVITI